jgi:integrase
MTARAFDLLLGQPDSLVGLANHVKANTVISALTDDAGSEHVLSRFGDAVWDLSPAIPNPNVAPHKKIIEWPEGVPATLLDDLKAVLYMWMRKGRPGRRPASAGTVANLFAASGPLLRWFAVHKVRSFSEFTPLHLATYLSECRAEGLKPNGLAHRFLLVDLAWTFRADTSMPIAFYPWGRVSFEYAMGVRGQASIDDGVGKTPIIPRQVQSSVFNHCMEIIDGAPTLFAERDEGTRSARSPELTKVRDACLYVVLVTTGMRQDEAIGISTNAYRTEVRNGTPYHWIRAIERKTGKGEVDYLAPELTLQVLRVLEQYAAPLQKALEREIAGLEERLAAKPNTDVRLAMLKRLADARAHRHTLFLAHSTKHDLIRPLTRGGVTCALRAMSRTARVKWTLSSHQCRRTYARMVVESSMGRVGLVFLKEQFKHSSLTMTQRYALNPAQDATLMEEMLEESIALRYELLDRWAADTPLSGGAGRRIVQMRATAVKDHEILFRKTAEAITIRGTGHGWCIAQDGGCGGGGLYDASQCVGCNNGVIDEEWVHVWHGIYEQHNELCAAPDLGPGARERVHRSRDAALRVLDELGVSVRG